MRYGKLAIVLSVFWLAFWAPMDAWAAVVGKFTVVEGNVDLTRPGQAAVAVKIGDNVSVGDFIRTKSRSRSEITYVDGNVVRLAESSRLRITEYSPDKNRQTLDLFRGKVHSAVKTAAEVTGATRGGAFEVRTPTAVAGVRGTQFFVYHQQGVSGVAFQEGTGYGYNRQFPQEVRSIGPGVVMLVTQPDALPILRPALPNEMEKHERDTAPGRAPAAQDSPKAETRAQDGPAAPVTYILPEAAPGEAAPMLMLVDAAPSPPTRPPEPVRVPPVGGDTTPPVITPRLLPSPVTGDPHTFFRYQTNEPARIAFQVDGGSWFSNATAPLDTDFIIDLHGLADGVHQLNLRATDEAGNVSNTFYRWFIGQRRFILSGQVGGGLKGSVLADSEGLRLVSNGTTGAWLINMMGTGSVPSGSFRAVAGGQRFLHGASTGSPDGYWLSRMHMQNLQGNLTGTSSFSYLSLNSLGSGTGLVSGTGGASGWQARDLGLGAYQETPITFGARLVGSFWSYVTTPTAPILTPGGILQGVWGATSPLGPNVPTLAMGQYQAPASFSLFAGEIIGYGGYFQNPTPIGTGGIISTGFFGGLAIDGRLEAGGRAVYYRNVGNQTPIYEVGYLVYNPNGAYYADLLLASGQPQSFAMWEAEGVATNFSILATPLIPQISAPYWENRSFAPALDDLMGQGLKLADTRLGTVELKSGSGDYMNWGIWQRINGGLWSTPFSPPDSGEKTVTAAWKTVKMDANSFESQYWLTEGIWSSAGTIMGNTLATLNSAYSVSPQTVIIAGDLKGTFNPTARTWQTVSTGVYMETARFLDMAKPENQAGRDALAALGIPAIQVGVANLNQTQGTVNNISNLTMQNVGFFAYSQGQAPKIWATGNVSGTYVAPPNVISGFPVPLSGDGLSATFNLNYWQPATTATGAWAATIDGSGALNNGFTSPIIIMGGAAGTVTSVSAGGTFSGSAAGIVLTPPSGSQGVH